MSATHPPHPLDRCIYTAHPSEVPNQPKTPLRSIRIPDDLWQSARDVAAARGDSLGDVIRQALTRYIARHKRETR